MKFGILVFIILCMLIGPVIADTNLTQGYGPEPFHDNFSQPLRYDHQYDIPPPQWGGFQDNNLNQSRPDNPGPPFSPRFPEDQMMRNISKQDRPIAIPSWHFPIISGGISLIILVIILIASLSITSAAVYQYQSSKRARQVLAVCHIISALIIGGFAVSLLIMGATKNEMDPFIGTLYAILGIVIYLALSSLIQAISLIKNRPLVPLHQAHLLFAVISIILLISNRMPGEMSVPLSIIVVSIVIIPGAVFSLITSNFIQKNVSSDFYTNGEQTITRSLPVISQDLPPSFPEKLATKYHDIQVIGSGGMAVVYRGTRNDDGKIVALKVPVSADETSGKTFLNEISVWRDLSHPNIVAIIDQNIFPVPYVELEYLPRSLKEMTRPVPPEKAKIIVEQIGSALLYAHEKGVIHRDIKPGNVLLTDEGIAKLTDWGLSRFLERKDDTRNTSFSLFYATPEQLSPDRYGKGDQRTDIYQLGILLYELICGNPPYGTENIGELFTKIQKNEYILPSEVNPNLSAFDEIISGTLKADPKERIQSVSEFLSILESINI